MFRFTLRELFWFVGIIFVGCVILIPLYRLMSYHNPTYGYDYRTTQAYIEQVGPPNKQFLSKALDKINTWNQHDYIVANAECFQTKLSITALTGNPQFPRQVILEMESAAPERIFVTEHEPKQGLICRINVEIPAEIDPAKITGVRLSDGNQITSETAPVSIAEP